MNTFNTIKLLVKREFYRLKAEPSRVVGMMLQPLLFLIVFGAGFHQSFFWAKSGDVAYSEFFFSGILALVLLFASIYSTLTLIDDKKCGLFRLVLVAPSGVFGAILGKVIATAILGFCQAAVFLALGTSIAFVLTWQTAFQAMVFLGLGSLMCSLLGVIFAWLSPSNAAFHALMSVVLIPMWLLSGAMFPLQGSWMEMLAVINPMSYLVEALRGVLIWQHFIWPNLIILLAICVFFACSLFFLSRFKKVE